MLEIQDLKDFSITNWYELFKDICPKTILIDIPEKLLEKFASGDSSFELNDICTEEFITSLKNALNTFNNNVFIKNNWHAPMDAKVFSFGNSLKVTSIEDIILFFTVSSMLENDFSNPQFKPFVFALREWKNIHPAAEFRCIVVNNILRGITPRDWPTFYSHYKEEGSRIIETIQKFFSEKIKHRFLRKTYVFDVVLSFPEEPYLLDFGLLNNKTNLYAFSWKELESIIKKNDMEEVSPVFRFLETDIGIMSKADALRKFAQAL